MKQYEDISQILEYMSKKHVNLQSHQKGVKGYKFFKHGNSRLLFEEITGFQIVDFQVFDNSDISITTVAKGFTYKNNVKTTVTAKLFLNDLALINVYEHSAEFLTCNSIDFSYIENDYDVSLKIFSNWLAKSPSELKAQWVKGDSVYARKLLQEFSVNKNLAPVENHRSRNILFQEDEL